MGVLSLVSGTCPSSELHLYLLFYNDLVRDGFLQPVNSCVVFQTLLLGGRIFGFEGLGGELCFKGF